MHASLIELRRGSGFYGEKWFAGLLPECLWENIHFVGSLCARPTQLNLHTITPQQTCNPIYELITSSRGGDGKKRSGGGGDDITFVRLYCGAL